MGSFLSRRLGISGTMGYPRHTTRARSLPCLDARYGELFRDRHVCLMTSHQARLCCRGGDWS
jgi:hypothetical protein